MTIKIKSFFLCVAVIIFSSACSNKFSQLAKYNKVKCPFYCEFSNDSAKLNFKTCGDYIYYNSKRNFKPTKYFDSKNVNDFKKLGFKILALAETDISPYYTFAVLHKKDKKFMNEIDSMFSYKQGNLLTLAKKITYYDNCFIIKFTWDDSQERDLFEDSLNFKIEFDSLIESVHFSSAEQKAKMDTVITAQSFDDQISKASEVLQKKEYCNALSLFQNAFKDSASIGIYEYAAGAAAAANCKQEKLALVWLKKSQQMGLGLKPGEIEYLETDSSFTKLHSFKEWNEMISSMKQILVDKKEKADKWLKTVTANCISKKQNEKYIIPKAGFALYYVTVDSFKVPYLVYIPKTYSASKPMQTIVYLHGGVASLNDYMLDELVTTSEPIFAEGDLFNAIIIYPFGKKDFGWMYQKKGFENILTIIKNTQQVYNIDDKRIFLGGMSNGGTATFWFASQKPNMFKGFYAFSMNPKLEIGEIDFKNMSQGKPFYSLNAKDDGTFKYDDVQKVYLSQKDIAKDWHFESVETGDHAFIYDGETGKKAMNNLLQKLLDK